MSEEKQFVGRGYKLTVFGGLLIVLSSFLEAVFVLHILGFSFFQKVDLTFDAKMLISLCVFLGLASATLALACAYLQWKGFIRVGGFSGFVAGALALLNVVVPFVYGYEAYNVFAIGTFLGVCLIAIGVELASSAPAVKLRGPFLTSLEAAVIAVLSAVYAVLIIAVRVPSPTGGYTHIGDVVVFVAALLFGYKVGGLVGVVGSVAADFYVGYERWFVSILAHGLEGLIPGLTKGRSLLVQAVACVVGGFLMATTYFLVNIFIKGYAPALISYMRDMFGQAGISIIVGLAVARVIRRAIPRLG
jgi:uncharacterized membrane protein